MSILDRIKVVCGDAREVAADLLILKYADGYYGADLAVAQELPAFDPPASGRVAYVPGGGIAADEVAFVGVGDLFDFRYREIRGFGEYTMNLLQIDRPDAATVATTIHGPGYGLDEREAFVSQLTGYLEYESVQPAPDLKQLIIVEQNATRAARLKRLLKQMKGAHVVPLEGRRGSGKTGLSYGTDHGTSAVVLGGQQRWAGTEQIILSDEEKPRLFVAMPFAEEHQDAYDIAFVEAAHAHGYICERLDLETYLGDVTAEISKRIRSAKGIIALLNDSNPNVYYEVGFAMALDKPIIFVAHKDQEIPFDLRNQRRQTYTRIAKLRDDMTQVIGDLKAAGTLT